MRFLIAGIHTGITMYYGPPDDLVAEVIVPYNPDSRFGFSIYGVAIDGKSVVFSPHHESMGLWKFSLMGIGRSEEIQIGSPRPETHWHGGTYHPETGYLITSTKSGILHVDENWDCQWIVPEKFDESWHLNGVLVHNGKVWFSQHRLSRKTANTSVVSVCELHDGELKAVEYYEGGHEIHDLVFVPKVGVVTCSSMESKVIGVDTDFELYVSPSEQIEEVYPRGLAYQDNHLIVGRSWSASKGRRGDGVCEFDVYSITPMTHATLITFVRRYTLDEPAAIHQIIPLP